MSDNNMKTPLLLLDPPWQYRVWSESKEGQDANATTRLASSHYDVQGIDWIKALPVKDMLEKDAHVVMWATYPNLEEAFAVGAAWGLRYSTVLFTWAKTQRRSRERMFFMSDEVFSKHSLWHIGLGHYSRANPEVALLFTTGKPLKRISRSVPNLIVSPIGEHSEKPEAAQDRIEQLFGASENRYVELFARRYRNDWWCYGNKLNGRDILMDMQEFMEQEDERERPDQSLEAARLTSDEGSD